MVQAVQPSSDRISTSGEQVVSLWRSRAGLQLLLIAIVTGCAFYARTSLGPLQEAISAALKLSDSQMALLQGPPLAIGVVIGIPAALLIDRWSRVRLLFVLSFIALVCSVTIARNSDFWILFGARCGIGMVAALAWTVSLSLVADWFAPEQRGRATMAVAIGASIGMSTAFGAGGTYLTLAGTAPDAWRTAMMWQSAPLALAVLVGFLMREPAKSAAAELHTPLKQVYAELWQYRAMLLPLLISFALVAGIADGAAVVWAAPALARTYGLSPDRVGAIMASVLLGMGVVAPALGGLLADYGQRTGGPRRTVVLLTIVMVIAIPAALFTFMPGFGSAGVLLAIFLVCGAAFQVGVFTLATIIVPPELRASCLALLTACALIFAFAIAPLMVSELSIVLGGPAMIGRSLSIVCAGSSLVGAVVFWLGRKHFKVEMQPAH